MTMNRSMRELNWGQEPTNNKVVHRVNEMIPFLVMGQRVKLNGNAMFIKHGSEAIVMGLIDIPKMGTHGYPTVKILIVEAPDVDYRFGGNKSFLGERTVGLNQIELIEEELLPEIVQRIKEEGLESSSNSSSTEVVQ